MNSDELTGAVWRKSSRSNGQYNCVEVAFLDGDRVAMRDSKDNGRGPALLFTSGEWHAFTKSMENGEFTRP
jgi:Domain of unknown function (DUF397)